MSAIEQLLAARKPVADQLVGGCPNLRKAEPAIVLRDNDTRSDEMLKLAVLGAKRNGRHVGICGEAPANYPEIAHYLAQLGIGSISVNPSSVLRTMQVVGEAETASAAPSLDHLPSFTLAGGNLPAARWNISAV